MNISDSFQNEIEKLEIPSYPFYGYDNSEAIDKDFSYIKSLYPSNVQKIQNEVDEECDKLEFDGSCMFDECPDRVKLNAIVDTIYNRISDVEEAELSKKEANNQRPDFGRNPWGWGDCNGHHCPRPRPDFRPNGRPDFKRGLIESLLFNEILHRRRRRRSRKRFERH